MKKKPTLKYRDEPLDESKCFKFEVSEAHLFPLGEEAKEHGKLFSEWCGFSCHLRISPKNLQRVENVFPSPNKLMRYIGDMLSDEIFQYETKGGK